MANPDNSKAVISPKLSFFTRLKLTAKIWFIKTLVYTLMLLKRNPWTGGSLTLKEGPTLTKKYPVRPSIECRVFIPKSYKKGDAKLPLLIDIHGGGFVLGAPVVDDESNLVFAHKHGFVVVSVGYRLAPRHPFPTASHDVAALILAAMDDASLPIDKSKVAVLGMSAGGNLALSAVQLYNLHNKVKASISYYGAVDLVTSREDKMATRVPDGLPDNLEGAVAAFNYAYVPFGTDRRDPLLSPLYAPREKLPKHLYLIGCEHDLLCNEQRVMADKLGELETEQKIMYPDGTGWRRGGIRWELVKGEIHGFNQAGSNGGPEVAARRAARSEKLYADTAKWLKEEVFV